MNLGQAYLLRAFLALIAAVAAAGAVFAAPDRLDDKVPDATPDEPSAFAASLGYEWLNLDGALVSQKTTHNLFKVRYQFNPKVHGSIAYRRHNLAGAEGLLSPLFNQRDNASVWSFDVGMNLLNTERVAAIDGAAFTPASAFTIGVGADFYDTSAGAVSESTTLLKAYLMYSTDLTEELRAHTYFSSGRLSGGGRSGSVNTIGAGLDYELMGGENPLTLLASGAMDIYNFRDPTFNTSRVSRFDLGLRYKAAPGMYTSLGWMTVNDSENDASGSGVFAGINWVKEKEKYIICDPVLEEEQEAAPQQAARTPASGGSQLTAAAQNPPMMDNNPALEYPGETLTSGLRGTEALITANSEAADPRSAPGKREVPELALYGGTDSAPQRTAASAGNSTDNAALESGSTEAVPEAPQYPVLLNPGRNAPLSPLKPETLEKVGAARQQVDAERVDTLSYMRTDELDKKAAASEPQVELSGEPVVIEDEAVIEHAALVEANANRHETRNGLAAAVEEPEFVEALPQETDSSAAGSGTALEPSSAPGSSKYQRSSRFEFPADTSTPSEPPVADPAPAPATPTAAVIAIEEAPESGLDAGETAAEAASAGEDTQDIQPVEPVEDNATADDPQAKVPSSMSPVPLPLIGASESEFDFAGTETVLAQVDLSNPPAVPLSSQGYREPQLDSAAGSGSGAVSEQRTAPPSRQGPRHTGSDDRMQRPPVSESAKSGLVRLMSLLDSVTAPEESSAEIEQPETIALDSLPVERSAGAVELLHPANG